MLSEPLSKISSLVMMTQVYPFSEPLFGALFFRPPSLIPDSSPGFRAFEMGRIGCGGSWLACARAASVVTRLGRLMSNLRGGEGDELTWLF